MCSTLLLLLLLLLLPQSVLVARKLLSPRHVSVADSSC
jgi:hypothetical protein